MTELTIKERDIKQKAAKLRASGVLPAVFYGPKEETVSIAIDAREFQKLWQEEGSSSIVTLTGVGDNKDALIHEVVTDPITGDLLHADLYVIEKGKKVEVDVPFEFTGEAPAEKAGHTVVKGMHELSIRVSPADLPQHIEIDVSNLKEIGDHITVSDIALPKSAELLVEPDETVVSVKEASEEPAEVQEEEAEAGAEEASEAATTEGEADGGAEGDGGDSEQK